MKGKSMMSKAEGLINVPTTLFIDTSYYVSQGLKFTTAEIDKLKKHFKPKSLRLVIPLVAQRELAKKFGERADAAVQVIQNAGQEYPVNLLSDWPYVSKDKSALRAKLLAAIEREWSQFKKHFKVIRLKDNGHLERVLDWYFQKQPPFGDGKKAKEFPDAFMISALDKYCAKHKAKLAVISRDGGFENASTSRPQFIYFESLSAYLEMSIAEQAIVRRIHKLLEDQNRVFHSGIEQHFEKLDLKAGQEWGFCAGDVQVTDVDIRKQSIIDLEGTKFTVVAEGYISFKVNVQLAGYSLSFLPAASFSESRPIRDRIKFSAVVEIKADADFSEIAGYSITDFSPKSVSIDTGPYHDWF